MHLSPAGTTVDKWCGELVPAQSSTAPNDVQHGVVVERLLWLPYQVVTYGFMDADDVATDYRKQRVRTALALYMQHTSIKFQEVNIKGFDFENIIARPLCKIRIGFGPVQNNSDGSVLWGWAKVGKSAVDSAFNGDMGYPGKKWSTIYLGGQALKSDAELTAADLAMSNATVYHELGHVLGKPEFFPLFFPLFPHT
jgi:hypothetical protein